MFFKKVAATEALQSEVAALRSVVEALKEAAAAKREADPPAQEEAAVIVDYAQADLADLQNFLDSNAIGHVYDVLVNAGYVSVSVLKTSLAGHDLEG